MKKLLALLALPLVLASAPLTGWAGDDHDHHRYPEGKQEFWDGPCKVKREWKKDGDYQEKRECKGLYPHAPHHDHKEKFRDGPCKVEREWKKDGEYKEKRECKGR
jgi:hypothetical protein